MSDIPTTPADKQTGGTSSKQRAPDTDRGRRAFRKDLLEWFDDQQRDLPWRGVDDPYAVWVSEVMLQQTRVDTVIDYFERWMKTFPTVESLAEAPVEEVLELWSGLGYYRRARYLHRAAAMVVDDFGGRLPESASELEELPGIGPYTAGAIASIAFGRQAPLVDGNVMRVLARIFTIEGKPRRSPAKQHIWARAEELVDPKRPGDFNQALMELGSQVCSSTSPRCLICPVQQWCQAQATGRPEQFPAPRERPEQRPMRARCCVIYRDEGPSRQLLLRRRQTGGLLGGLWEFPSCEKEGKSWPDVDSLAQTLADRSDGVIDISADDIGRALGTVTHVFSHRRLKVRVHTINFDTGRGGFGDLTGWQWVDAEALGDVASSALLQKVEGVFDDHR